jgi:hypothetical protein
MSTFICIHCRKIAQANTRLIKGVQKYCNDPACQQARKRAWHRQKMTCDDDYRKQQSDSMENWCQKRPLHQYQRQYRIDHPEYVIKNRQQQRIRNQKRTVDASMIVKMDAFDQQPSIKTGLYEFTPCQVNASGKIVKMDALALQVLFLPKFKPA